MKRKRKKSTSVARPRRRVSSVSRSKRRRPRRVGSAFGFSGFGGGKGQDVMGVVLAVVVFRLIRKYAAEWLIKSNIAKDGKIFGLQPDAVVALAVFLLASKVPGLNKLKQLPTIALVMAVNEFMPNFGIFNGFMVPKSGYMPARDYSQLGATMISNGATPAAVHSISQPVNSMPETFI